MSAITWARAGDTMDVPAADDRFERVMLWRRCDWSSSLGYFCEPCQRTLANVGNLVMHLEDAPAAPHRIAVWCPADRRWEGADEQQMRALVGVAA